MADILGLPPISRIQADNRYVQGGQTPTLPFSRQTGANDTAKLTNAIAAANALNDDVFIDLEGKTISITGVTLNNYTKICNGKIIRASGTSPLLSLPLQANLQTARKSVLRDLQLDGSNKTTGTIGILIDNHAAVFMDNVTVTNEDIGVRLNGTQFGTFYSVKTYNNNVGLHIRNKTSGGGGNSLSFYDLHSNSNKVNVLVQNVAPGTWPEHSIYFYNPSILGELGTLNICGLAVYNAHVTLYGSANEVNAASGAAATYTVDSTVIKKASIYGYGARLQLNDQYVAEATAEPAIILEADSHASINNITGYGNTGGQLLACDDTSDVIVNGEYSCIGVLNGVTSFSAAIHNATTGIVAGPMASIVSPNLTNEVVNPQAPIAGDANGTTAQSYGYDQFVGEYLAVQYAATAGDQNTNRLRVQLAYATGPYLAVSMLMKSSVAAKFRVGPFGVNNGAQQVALPAGRWTRVTVFLNNAPVNGTSWIINAADTAGATVQFAHLNSVSSATDSVDWRSKLSSMAGGAYNPNGVLAAPSPALASGRYIAAVAGNLNTQTMTQSVLYAGPGIIGRSGTIDRLCLEVTVATTGSTIRLGIYSDRNGLPGQLILDAGTIDGATTGAKEITISQYLSAGRYWFAAVSQGAQAVVRSSLYGAIAPSTSAQNASQYPATSLSVGSITGALPTSFGTPSGAASDAPRVVVRAA